MDLISDNSLYRVVHVPSLVHGQSLSLSLAATSHHHRHCSALSLSQECHSSLSLALACVDAFYVPFLRYLDRGVVTCALVCPCDCGVCVVICAHGSPVDTVVEVHFREKTARPQGEGQEEGEMERPSCFFLSGSRCLRRT